MNSISSVNFNSNYNIQSKEEKIVNLALTEAVSRLRLKFIDSNINKASVQFVKIEPKTFYDGSLECKRSKIATLTINNGYIISVKFHDDIYHLHTVDGNSFFSDDLLFEKYPVEMIQHVHNKLSNEVGKLINDPLIFDAIELANGTLLSWNECGDDVVKYCYQESEIVFVFELTYEGKNYQFCLNEAGETRYKRV
jgi:hypothetical protein